jgi:hypothetical protein
VPCGLGVFAFGLANADEEVSALQRNICALKLVEQDLQA